MDGKPKRSDFWAKLEEDENGEVIAWHPLRAHSADVAACTEAFLERTILGDRLASLLTWERLESVHISRLSALAALHDAGKANLGFQARSASSKDNWAGHVSEMISTLGKKPELLEALGVVPMLDWFESEYRQRGIIDMLCATWAHHGRPVSTKTPTFDERLWNTDGDHDPADGLRQLAS
ncbi:MAG: HD domain-containing protein, partial [Bradymonadaceae bacterium]